jgi:hypothetical protein
MTSRTTGRAIARRSLVARAGLGLATAASGALAAPAILAQQPRAIRMGYVMGAGGAATAASSSPSAAAPPVDIAAPAYGRPVRKRKASIHEDFVDQPWRSSKKGPSADLSQEMDDA